MMIREGSITACVSGSRRGAVRSVPKKSFSVDESKNGAGPRAPPAARAAWLTAPSPLGPPGKPGSPSNPINAWQIASETSTVPGFIGSTTS